MTGPGDDLERRLRAHFRSLPDSLPSGLQEQVRAQIRTGPTRRSLSWAGLAAAIGVVSLALAVLAVSSSPVPIPEPPSAAVPSPEASPTTEPTASPTTPSISTTFRAGDVVIVTNDGLADSIEAYRGDRLYIAEILSSPGGPIYRLEGPPRSAQEDAARVELPASIVEAATARSSAACPAAPSTLSELETLRPFERFVCFEELTLTLRDVWAEAGTAGGDTPGPLRAGRLSRFGEPGSGWLPYAVEGTVIPAGWSTVTGSFGWAEASCGDWAGQLICLERFVVDAVAPGASPFTELAGSWTRMSDAPIAGRSGYVALPIDRGTFIWAGDGPEPEAGAIYRAADDTWTRVAPVADQSIRYSPTAAWTGEEVLIWGGNDDPEGLRYDPRLDRWATLPASPIDPGYALGAWTGSEFVVITGAAQAAAWNPASMTWRRLPGAPLPQGAMVNVWTGQELIVLGLTEGGTDPLIGAALDPSSGAWRPIAEVPYDGLVLGIRPVWTGREMVFAQHAYDPVTDRWRALSTEGCWSSDVSSGVWTGRWVIGQVQAYDPATGRCQLLPEGPPRPDYEVGAFHEFATPAWDDGRLVIWSGGTGMDGPLPPPDGIVFTPDGS